MYCESENLDFIPRFEVSCFLFYQKKVLSKSELLAGSVIKKFDVPFDAAAAKNSTVADKKIRAHFH